MDRRREEVTLKVLALFLGVLVVALGLVGVIAPGLLVTLGQHSVTPVGLYWVAALRVILGLVLLGASAASGMPRTLRVLGILALAGGLATLFLSAERAGAIMNWMLAPGPLVVRLWALLAVAFGSFIIYAVVSRQRAA
jgi:hypothetical protein